MSILDMLLTRRASNPRTLAYLSSEDIASPHTKSETSRGVHLHTKTFVITHVSSLPSYVNFLGRKYKVRSMSEQYALYLLRFPYSIDQMICNIWKIIFPLLSISIITYRRAPLLLPLLHVYYHRKLVRL